MAGPIIIKLSKSVGKQVGKRLTKQAAKKAKSRLVGHVERGSQAWSKAFGHIRDHFRPMKGKPTHAIFNKKYRTEEALKGLVRQAASNPSRTPCVTRLTIGGENIGRPAVILERQFKQAIGTCGDEACHILRVVVDYTGRPITAYPVRQFLGISGSATAQNAARGVAGAATAAGIAIVGRATPVNAKSPVDIYSELLLAERSEQAKRSEGACEPDDVVGWVIDFLVTPSCIAPDAHQLITKAEVNRRVARLISNLVNLTGQTIDDKTRANIRSDVIAAWGMGYMME